MANHDGCDLRSRFHGSPDGRTIALIPSLGRSRHDFDVIVPSLVDAGLRVVTLELPGVGGRPDLAEDATLHDLAADVAEAIQELNGPVDLLGHAFGSRIARCVAVNHPSSVQSLTLLSAGGLIDPGPALHRRRKVALLSEDPTERLAALEEVFFAPASDATVWLGGWWPSAIRSHSKANMRTPLDEWWHGGDLPIHIVQGSLDVDATPANAYLMQRLLGRRVEVTEVADAGHALLPEQPDRVAEAIIRFLFQMAE